MIETRPLPYAVSLPDAGRSTHGNCCIDRLNRQP